MMGDLPSVLRSLCAHGSEFFLGFNRGHRRLDHLSACDCAFCEKEKRLVSQVDEILNSGTGLKNHREMFCLHSEVLHPHRMGEY